MKNTDEFLFNTGEKVTYEHRQERKSTGEIIKREKVKHFLLSELNGCDIFENTYTVKETFAGLGKSESTFFYEDPEIYLRSADIAKPKGAVDYESDEFSADFMDAKGNVLKTVKAGKIGKAHELVRSLIN